MLRNAITNEEENTEDGGQDEHIVDAVKKKSDFKKFMAALVKAADYRILARRRALKRPDGTMIPYDEFRDDLVAKVRAVCTAVAVAVAVVILAAVTGHKAIFIWLGTGLVGLGTWIIARGAWLAAAANDWLQEVEAQQAKQKTIYVHEAAVLRQLRSVYVAVKYPHFAPKALNNVNRQLQEKSWKGDKRYIITQADLARLFLDASGASKLGTPIAILGGIVIALGS